MTARLRQPWRGTTAGLTLLTLAALLSGCSSSSSTQPGAEPPAAPGQTSASAASPSAAPAGTALNDSPPFKALTPEQQQKISALEAMDQATFEKQGREDQLAYGAFLREVYQADAVAGAAGTATGVPNPAAATVSQTSTGAEILNDEGLKAATARRSAQADGNVAQTPALSGSNYAKMAPSRVSPLYPAAYAEASAPSEPTPQAVLSGLSDPQRMTIVAQSNNFIPFDGSMEQLQFRILELQSTATQARSQFYFAYTPFTDIHGAKDGVWILMLNAQESQDKWIPDLSVID